MASKLTLANVRLVLTGTFGSADPEDVKWDLIARGASVMTSLIKTTGALIAGADPKRALVEKAEKLGVPLVDADGLRALLDGVPLPEVVAGRKAGDESRAAAPTLADKIVAISGSFAGQTRGSLSAALERLGARVVSRPSTSVNLIVVGEKPTFDAIEAMDAGVPFVKRSALDALLTGAKLSDFIAAPGPAVADPQARVREILDAVHGTLVARVSGERWEDELSVTVTANGRVRAELRDLGGTPLHDHVREVLQRQSWPKVAADCTVTMPVVFG